MGQLESKLRKLKQPKKHAARPAQSTVQRPKEGELGVHWATTSAVAASADSSNNPPEPSVCAEVREPPCEPSRAYDHSIDHHHYQAPVHHYHQSHQETTYNHSSTPEVSYSSGALGGHSYSAGDSGGGGSAGDSSGGGGGGDSSGGGGL